MRRLLVLCGIALAAMIAAGPAEAQVAFAAVATGAQEVPPPGVDTDAHADVLVRFSPGLTRARVLVRISGVPTVMGAHFHCNRAGANGPVAFGVISPGDCEVENGRIQCTITNDDATLADCLPTIGRPVNNIASLRAAMEEGGIYFNLHTPSFPGGEIRGQMLPVPVRALVEGPGDDEHSDDIGDGLESDVEPAGGGHDFGRR